MDASNTKPKYKLKAASQAEILRSHQRDDTFIKQLRERLSELLQIFGRKGSLYNLVNSDIPYKLIYYTVTSGMRNQTLGEEYTGIVQADFKAYKVPSLMARILAAILECFGERTLYKMLESLQSHVNHSELTPKAIIFLNTFLSKLRVMIPILILIHKGIFYMQGQYYNLGRRVAGINYAKVYGHQLIDGISWELKLLGIATLLQCALRFWQLGFKTEDENFESKGEIDYERIVKHSDKEYISRNCLLCLEAEITTAIPCGHVFCWDCLKGLITTKPQCPLCREQIIASRIVHLMNL